MIFAKMDVTLRDHAKLIKAIGKVGWGALGVYAWAMMYLRAAETEDGVLADDVVELSMPNQKDTKKIIAALVDVGLLVRRDAGGGSSGGGYYLDKYETKNETKAVIAERRAATAERVTRYRGVRNGVTGPSVTLLHPQTENAFVPGSDSDSVLRSDQGVQGGMAPLPSDAEVTPGAPDDFRRGGDEHRRPAGDRSRVGQVQEQRRHQTQGLRELDRVVARVAR